MPVRGVCPRKGAPVTGLPIHAAAEELGVSVATLRRWMREGCPVASRGRRGRGCRTMINPVAVRAWHRAQGGEDALTSFAGRVPQMLADAVAETFRLATGPYKRQAAGVLAGGWYLSATRLLDALREAGAEVPELSELPEQVAYLRKIARD